MKLKISDYCLIVENVDRAAAFYRDVIGLPMRLRNEDFADFEMSSGVRLALWEHPHVAEAVGKDNIGVRGNRIMGAVQMESAEEVDAAYEKLNAKGVNFIVPPKEWPWGAYAAYFADPDGYLWEFYTWVKEPRTLE